MILGSWIADDICFYTAYQQMTALIDLMNTAFVPVW